MSFDQPSRLLRFALTLSVLVPLNACGLSGGPVTGQVLEEETNKPIPGAIVVVKWEGQALAFAHSRTVCMHVDSAITDQEGKFRVMGWREPSTVGALVMDLTPAITTYARGYSWTRKPSMNRNLVHMPLFRGTPVERLDYLSRVFASSSCGSQSESEKNLVPIRKAVHAEALSLAQTKEDKNKVEGFLYGLEIIEYGFEAAEKRHLERVSK